MQESRFEIMNEEHEFPTLVARIYVDGEKTSAFIPLQKGGTVFTDRPKTMNDSEYNKFLEQIKKEDERPF